MNLLLHGEPVHPEPVPLSGPPIQTSKCEIDLAFRFPIIITQTRTAPLTMTTAMQSIVFTHDYNVTFLN